MDPDNPTVAKDGLPSSKNEELVCATGTRWHTGRDCRSALPRTCSGKLCFVRLRARQPNLHIERIEVALAALPETDAKFLRELAKAFQCYVKLAAVFRIFIRYHDESPQVEVSSIRYYDVDNPNDGAKRRCSLSTGPASTDV